MEGGLGGRTRTIKSKNWYRWSWEEEERRSAQKRRERRKRRATHVSVSVDDLTRMVIRGERRKWGQGVGEKSLRFLIGDRDDHFYCARVLLVHVQVHHKPVEDLAKV